MRASGAQKRLRAGAARTGASTGTSTTAVLRHHGHGHGGGNTEVEGARARRSCASSRAVARQLGAEAGRGTTAAGKLGCGYRPGTTTVGELEHGGAGSWTWHGAGRRQRGDATRRGVLQRRRASNYTRGEASAGRGHEPEGEHRGGAAAAARAGRAAARARGRATCSSGARRVGRDAARGSEGERGEGGGRAGASGRGGARWAATARRAGLGASCELDSFTTSSAQGSDGGMRGARGVRASSKQSGKQAISPNAYHCWRSCFLPSLRCTVRTMQTVFYLSNLQNVVGVNLSM